MAELTTFADKTVNECAEHMTPPSDPWVPADTYTVRLRNIQEKTYPEVYPSGAVPDYPKRSYLRAFVTVEGTEAAFTCKLEPEDFVGDESRGAFKRWKNYVQAHNLQGASLAHVTEHMEEIGCRWRVGLRAENGDGHSTFPRSNEEVKQAISEGRTLKNYLDSRPRAVRPVA